MIAFLVGVVASILLGVVVGFGSIAGAQPVTTGPTVALDRYQMSPGDRLVLTIDGFDAGSVIISVCGNDGRRGATDCNMTESEGLRLNLDAGETVSSIPVATPPAPCPCIVRVSSTGNDEVAVAAIDLVGHPVAPVVGTPSLVDALAVSVTAEAAYGGVIGWVRSSLGGAVAYDVTVTIRNRSTVSLERIAVAGDVGRDAQNVLTSLDLSDPGVIAPGQTWTEVVRAELPAPAYGTVEWRVDVSGVGPTVTATESTRHTPVLLAVLVVVLVVDLAILLWRFVARRRRRSRHAPPDGMPSAIDPDDDGGGWADPDTTETPIVEVVDDRPIREPVGV